MDGLANEGMPIRVLRLARTTVALQCVALRCISLPGSTVYRLHPGHFVSSQSKHNMAYLPAFNACFGLHDDGDAMR